MRRLYILVAAALIAASMVALTMAGAAGAKSKNYTAIALSSSVALTTSGDATSKQGAKNKAWRQCDSAASQEASYEGDCEIAVWVKNGWAAVAFESTLEGPPFSSSPSWGYGYGSTRSDARDAAVYYCRQDANEFCTVDRTERTRYFNSSRSTIGGG